LATLTAAFWSNAAAPAADVASAVLATRAVPALNSMDIYQLLFPSTRRWAPLRPDRQDGVFHA
jgi:hypothetical protein